MGVSSAYMSVYHMTSWCLGKPKKGIGSPGVTGWLGATHEYSRRTYNVLTVEISCQPQNYLLRQKSTNKKVKEKLNVAPGVENIISAFFFQSSCSLEYSMSPPLNIGVVL